MFMDIKITDKEQIENEIDSWLGGRWIHGQAVKGVGADCVQFVIAVAKNLGWLKGDYKSISYYRDYAIRNDKSFILEEIKKEAKEVTGTPYQTGDIVVINNGKCAGHMGFYVGDEMIVHSHIRRGIVKEYLREYETKINSVWRVI